MNALNKIMVLLVMVFGALSVACGHKCEGSYTISLEDYEKLAGSIEVSSENWKAWTAGKKTVQVNVVPTKQDMCHIEIGALPKTFVGMHYTLTGNITIDYNKILMNEARFAITSEELMYAVSGVVSHELGHNFGLGHVSERGSVMSSKGSSYYWTSLDQRECEKAGACYSDEPMASAEEHHGHGDYECE